MALSIAVQANHDKQVKEVQDLIKAERKEREINDVVHRCSCGAWRHKELEVCSHCFARESGGKY